MLLSERNHPVPPLQARPSTHREKGLDRPEMIDAPFSLGFISRKIKFMRYLTIL
jgi:hypothetical protein